MRRKYPYLATIAATMLLTQAASASPLFPEVLVAPAPLKPYVDAVLQGVGTSKPLLRPGQDAHDFVLSPSQAESLLSADIIVVADLRMSPFLKRFLAKHPEILVIELIQLKGADPLPYAAENPWLTQLKSSPRSSAKPAKTSQAEPQEQEHAHEHAQEHKDKETLITDPHLWLDPVRMAAIAPALADRMSTRLTEQAALMHANAAILAKHLTHDVTPALRRLLDKPSAARDATGRITIPFLTYHAAYQYFLTRFGLEHYGELTQRPEDARGARATAALLRSAEIQRVRCLIGEHEGQLMHRVAETTGARITLLSPEQLIEHRAVDTPEWVTNGYDQFLYTTAKTFAGCL